MRSLTRNQQKIYYARVVLGDPILDAQGNETEEKHKSYDSIQELWINVFPGQSSVYQNPFGESVQCDKVLSISDPALFSEDDTDVVFWIGKQPPETIVPDAQSHNYVFAGIAASLNELKIAVQKVNVS